MEDFVKTDLAEKDVSEFHKEMLTHCKSLVKMSREKMSQHYTDWDKADQTYRGLIVPDVQDKKAEERGEPIKMVVPLTYSQVQTFIAFCFAVYYQKETFYELVPMGQEDYIPAKVAQALLERDLDYSQFDARLYQFLLDVARFGIGIFKTGWVRETQKVWEQVEKEGIKLFGFLNLRKPQKELELVLKTKYLGNRVLNISPYRFFPDPRLPISRFQEGEFCASEDEYSWHELKKMESDGAVIGMDHVTGKKKSEMRDRGGITRYPGFRATDGEVDPLAAEGASLGTVIVTEVQVTIVPNRFKVGDKMLGEQDYPVKYNVWIANDQRVIKCEPLDYLHDQYTYDVGEFSPDMHNFLNPGLADTIDQLQSVVSWLINSHITSVRKTIQNWILVDPEKIEMSDLHNRRPVIRMKPGAGLAGIDKYVHQLDVRDVTQNHMKDANELQNIVQVVTGINENALGQFHSGRRSATEARNVSSAAASRLKVPVQVLFKTAFAPLGRKLISNLRDGLDIDTYIRVVGDAANLGDLAQFKKVTRVDLIGEYDFAVFDGTLPSERGKQAESLQELFGILLSVPQLIQVMGYDLGAILRELLVLKGIKHPDRFRIQGATQPPIMPQLGNPDESSTTGAGGPTAGAGVGPAAGLPTPLPSF